MWKARNSSSRYAMRFDFSWCSYCYILLFLEDVYDGYPSPSFLLVHGLSDSVHNSEGMAMVYGELQRMRSDVFVDGCWWFDGWCVSWWTLTVGYDPLMAIEVCAPAMCLRWDRGCVELSRWMCIGSMVRLFVADGDGWCTWRVLSSMFAIFCRRGTEFYLVRKRCPWRYR